MQLLHKKDLSFIIMFIINNNEIFIIICKNRINKRDVFLK